MWGKDVFWTNLSIAYMQLITGIFSAKLAGGWFWHKRRKDLIETANISMLKVIKGILMTGSASILAMDKFSQL